MLIFQRKDVRELESTYTMESTFENIAETREDKPVGYPSTYGDDPNYKVSSLSSDGQTGGMGPSLLVKVERGAELSVSAEYFYKEEIEGSTYESMGMFVTQILAGLASNATGVLPLSETALMEMTAGQGEYFDEVFNFLSSSMDPENLTKPQAYLVYLFYDLNMNLVQTSSGVRFPKNCSV